MWALGLQHTLPDGPNPLTLYLKKFKSAPCRGARDFGLIFSIWESRHHLQCSPPQQLQQRFIRNVSPHEQHQRVHVGHFLTPLSPPIHHTHHSPGRDRTCVYGGTASVPAGGTMLSAIYECLPCAKHCTHTASRPCSRPGLP